MAERKATNKYYPPDWDPSKGSVNRHQKSHPLRDRARKIDEGILVVRFEMPFNIWCLGCNNHIAMGVRFNAEKSKVGNYYTSPIYKFRMKCRHCHNYFEIQTDPSKLDYVILSGARKQVRLSEVEEVTELGQVVMSDDETRRNMTDAMFRLEKKVEVEIQGESKISELHELKRWRSRWEDSFAANQLLRSHYRQKRKSIEQTRERDKRLLKKMCLKIPLVKSDPMDTKVAKEILSESLAAKLIASEVSQKKAVLNSDIIPRIGAKKEKPAKSGLESASECSHKHRDKPSLHIKIKRESR